MEQICDTKSYWCDISETPRTIGNDKHENTNENDNSTNDNKNKDEHDAPGTNNGDARCGRM